MRAIRPSRADPATPRGWEAPAVTKLAVGAETKFARKNERNVGASGSGHVAEPQPPATPATKLGFAFELAFPLSARVDH